MTDTMSALTIMESETYGADNTEDIENIDASSINSLESELSSIDLNEGQYNVLRIKHNRNRPRISHGKYLGALAFDIIWQDYSETREPIQNLIDKDSNSINEFIIDAISDYKETAIKYPSNNRCCIMCWQKATNGLFMCYEHNQIFNFLN